MDCCRFVLSFPSEWFLKLSCLVFKKLYWSIESVLSCNTLGGDEEIRTPVQTKILNNLSTSVVYSSLYIDLRMLNHLQIVLNKQEILSSEVSLIPISYDNH